MSGFPRQHARTRRFSLGVPRAFAVGAAAHGPVLFLRSDTGTDPVTHLWRHDPASGETRKLVDARELGTDEELPPAERARRERARELAGGITSYACDRNLRVVAFAVGGRLYTVDVATGRRVEQPTAGPAFDPRPGPDGSRVAYHAGDGLHLVDLADGPAARGTGRPLVHEPEVVWGRAEFVAAEEMGRSRGFWWSGDGRRLAAARVDERRVPVWYLGDPANPQRPPVAHRYPAVGSVNADVGLAVVDVASGDRVPVRWDAVRDEYLAAVSWGADPLTLLVQPRDQRTAHVLRADPDSGDVEEVRCWHDEAWVELVPGTPAWAGAAVVTVEDRHDRGPAGTRSLCLDGTPVTPAGLQVREVVRATQQAVVFLATDGDPTQVHAYRLELDGPSSPVVRSLSEGIPGLHREVVGPDGSGPSVRISHTLESPRPQVTVVLDAADGGSRGEGAVQSLEVRSEVPVVTAAPQLLELGPAGLRAALFVPTDDDGRAALPVLLDPYGGPHVQRVVRSHLAHATSQWFADQGFAVLVVDGRGSPGRGPAWERAVLGDLASPVLDDQIDALYAAAVVEPRLDLSRVGIRGWSFGGYLAALAVLRRPDVFRAAVAGAPVTDWRLYDTHYTERYLGDPADGAAYVRSSLVDADGRLVDAAPWSAHDPPALLLIHGLADDNVVAAHSLRLSAALLAEGRPHRFLPLSGVTHMTPQETVAEHLLTGQAAFLREALRVGT